MGAWALLEKQTAQYHRKRDLIQNGTSFILSSGNHSFPNKEWKNCAYKVTFAGSTSIKLKRIWAWCRCDRLKLLLCNAKEVRIWNSPLSWVYRTRLFPFRSFSRLTEQSICLQHKKGSSSPRIAICVWVQSSVKLQEDLHTEAFHVYSPIMKNNCRL